jgi:hypothetical protein
VGAQAKLFNKLTLHAQMLSSLGMKESYRSFTELWARWQFSDSLLLTVRQQKHRFTHDRKVPSRYITFLERNMFALD